MKHLVVFYSRWLHQNRPPKTAQMNRHNNSSPHHKANSTRRRTGGTPTIPMHALLFPHHQKRLCRKWSKCLSDENRSDKRKVISVGEIEMISRQSPNCIVKFVDTLLSSYHKQIYIGSYINCLKRLFELSRLPPWCDISIILTA